MIQIRKSQDRGHNRIDWLDSYHTFSFGGYQDPDHVQFGPLRVINEDVIAGGGGFGEHPHREMEIITWVLDGAIRHGDSLGHGGMIRPGDAQRMSAGRGIRHSEFNDSRSDPAHLLQIWIHPGREHVGIEPGYEQRHFEAGELHNRLRPIATPDARDGSLLIHQDATVLVGELDAGASVSHDTSNDRGTWVQVSRGAITLDGQKLEAGDGAAITGQSAVNITADEASQVIVFDLPLD